MSYNDFAYIYDAVINVDYKKWVDYIEEIFKNNKTNPSLVLELACGTGNITLEMSNRGYDMIGIDKSSDMLSVAQQKASIAGKEILFSNQDMTGFELYGSVDVVLCLMDGINYLLEENEILKMFELVNYYLNPGGLFIFDIRTQYALSDIISNNTFIEDDENVTYIWQNEYDSKNDISNMDLTFFVKKNEAYYKFDETHSLKAYKIEKILNLLKKANLEAVDIYDNMQFEQPNDQSERVFFISKKIS